MSGLVGHWPLHEWSGDAADLSGEGNDGTVNGATQGVWGPAGLTAYSFDGTDDRVQTADNIWDDYANGEFTMACWVRPESVSTDSIPFTAESAWFIRVNANGNSKVNVTYAGGGNYANSTNTLPTDTWTHIAAVHNNGITKLYIDGSLDATRSESMASLSNARAVVIGAADDGGVEFNGYVCDCRGYNRALFPQEIQTLYEWGSGDYTRQSLHDGTDSGAVSRWKLDSGSVTSDSWGSNTLTDNTSAGTTTDAVDGDAKSFDGTDDWMDTGYNADVTTSFTWTAWANSQDASTTSGLYFMTDHDGSGGAVLGTYANSEDYRFYIYDGSGNATQLNSVTAGHFAWHHIAGVYDGSEMKLYLDGVLQDTASVTPGNTTNSVVLGRNQSGTTGGEWNGYLDDVRIYDRALSAAEVAQLYRQYPGGRDLRARMVIA